MIRNPFRWIKDVLTAPRRLKEEFQKKMSEAHLHIKTGEVSPEGLDQATETLKSIRDKKLTIL